jgi:uncharacterized repeat protein (TIGR03803 family)
VNKLSRWKTIFFLCVFCAVEAIGSSAPTFKTLVDFDRTNGSSPESVLVQGPDGNFYGTTYFGGDLTCNAPDGCGTVFKITSKGRLTTLLSFNGTDGANPEAGLVLGTDGNFYGTTEFGGDLTCKAPYGCGSVFKITPGGRLTTLHSFDGTDGSVPFAGLVQGTDGNFYGTTEEGGAYDNCKFGCGTVFKITSGGTLTTLHSFSGSPTEGSSPTGLVQANDGNLYGTTYDGGAMRDGTVFKIALAGKLTTLHSFDGTDGAIPVAGLVQATNGNFYGTTYGNGDGTVFEITHGGQLTTLYRFCAQARCTDGAFPFTALIQTTDGNFYGTTEGAGITGGVCGTFGCGTMFKITTDGKLTTLHSFDRNDGANPLAGFVEGTNGTFYGTTSGGGATDACSIGCGTVFSLSVGLGPFVEPVTYSGKAGHTIEFLGQGFTSSTTVSFNGKAAIRKVISGTYLTATVPSGATTGFVTVTTSGGTLKSNKIFRVIP